MHPRLRCIFPLLAGLLAAGAQTPSAPAPSPASTPAPEGEALFELGKQLFEQYAPPEVKEQYEFPSKDQWDAFTIRLQHALESGSPEELAAYEPEARAALAALRLFPGYEDYAEWLEERLDYITAAKEITTLAPPSAPLPSPGTTPVVRPTPGRLPYYDLWLARVRNRPTPARAAGLMPELRSAFVAEGMPPELAWLAEAESSFNPSARSPAGAKGLFQFMPDTAKSLGLSTFMPDDRTSTEKSARAAARYLKTLHARFGDWPLTFAAYNAGEGRVSRALQARSAKDFAGVASALPMETRMYVPKVCALVAVRGGVPPEKIPRPQD